MEVEFNPKGKLIIENVYAWMDGGTVTLITRDSQSNSFEIEFVQKMSLAPRLPLPGSLLLDKMNVPIRSETESRILSSIKNAEWGSKILNKEKKLLTSIIAECVAFVESRLYGIGKEDGANKIVVFHQRTCTLTTAC